MDSVQCVLLVVLCFVASVITNVIGKGVAQKSFDLDGDPFGLGSDNGVAIDWETLYAMSLMHPFSGVFSESQADSAGNNIGFTGGSSKDINPISKWLWADTNGMFEINIFQKFRMIIQGKRNSIRNPFANLYLCS